MKTVMLSVICRMVIFVVVIGVFKVMVNLCTRIGYNEYEKRDLLDREKHLLKTLDKNTGIDASKSYSTTITKQISKMIEGAFVVDEYNLEIEGVSEDKRTMIENYMSSEIIIFKHFKKYKFENHRLAKRVYEGTYSTGSL